MRYSKRKMPEKCKMLEDFAVGKELVIINVGTDIMPTSYRNLKLPGEKKNKSASIITEHTQRLYRVLDL